MVWGLNFDKSSPGRRTMSLLALALRRAAAGGAVFRVQEVKGF